MSRIGEFPSIDKVPESIRTASSVANDILSRRFSPRKTSSKKRSAQKLPVKNTVTFEEFFRFLVTKGVPLAFILLFMICMGGRFQCSHTPDSELNDSQRAEKVKWELVTARAMLKAEAEKQERGY